MVGGQGSDKGLSGREVRRAQFTGANTMPACAPGRSQAASQLVSHSVSASTCYVTQTHILTHTHRHTGTCMKHVISYTVNG